MTHECAVPMTHEQRSWRCRRCGSEWQVVPEWDIFGPRDHWFQVTPSGPVKRFPWAWLLMAAAIVVALVWLLFTAVVHNSVPFIAASLAVGGIVQAFREGLL